MQTTMQIKSYYCLELDHQTSEPIHYSEPNSWFSSCNYYFVPLSTILCTAIAYMLFEEVFCKQTSTRPRQKKEIVVSCDCSRSKPENQRIPHELLLRIVEHQMLTIFPGRITSGHGRRQLTTCSKMTIHRLQPDQMALK